MVLCFLCAARVKLAVESGAIDAQQANVVAAVTWAPILTEMGACVVPVCANCIPVQSAEQLDTTTKIPESLLKASRNGSVIEKES